MPLTTSLNTGFRCFPREKNFDNELERAFIFFFSDIDCSQLSWTPKSKTSESRGVRPWLKSDCEPEEADSTGEVNEDSGRGQLSEMKKLQLNNSNNNQVYLEMVAFLALDCHLFTVSYFISPAILNWHFLSWTKINSICRPVKEKANNVGNFNNIAPRSHCMDHF